MSIITRTYSFTDGTTAYGSQVDSEIANIVNTLNNLDSAATTWTNVKVTTLSPQADVNAGGHKITNLGTASTTGDALVYGGAIRGTTLTLTSTVGSNITFDDNSTHGVVGTITNNSAATGNIGEYSESYNNPPNNFPATTVWGDGTSLTLSGGDWDVTAVIHCAVATTVGEIQFGISQTSGNSSTGLQFGNNATSISIPDTAVGSGNIGNCLGTYRQSLSTSTIIYLKVKATYSGAIPTYGCRLSARRVR